MSKEFNVNALIAALSPELVATLCPNNMSCNEFAQRILEPIYQQHNQFQCTEDLAEYLRSFGKEGFDKLCDQSRHVLTKATCITAMDVALQDMIKQKQMQRDLLRKELEGLCLLYNMDIDWAFPGTSDL